MIILFCILMNGDLNGWFRLYLCEKIVRLDFIFFILDI